LILHIDMDAFYASVEERDRPELAGQPVIVGGTPEGRGVVAAANYEVRKYGVHSAMPAATAKRLCPQAVFLRPRMDYYAEVSKQIRAIFGRYTPLVEPLSLDEAFLDVTGTEGLFGPPAELGRQIKREIRDELRLTASAGVARNKFLAKIASDLDKPDGFVVVEPGREQEFLDPLPIGRLWGVGRATGGKLEKLGVQTIGQLRQLSSELLTEQFGKHGGHLWQLAHCIDDRKVVPDRYHQPRNAAGLAAAADRTGRRTTAPARPAGNHGADQSPLLGLSHDHACAVVTFCDGRHARHLDRRLAVAGGPFTDPAAADSAAGRRRQRVRNRRTAAAIAVSGS
jgi:nucleotidyltransferase/DNA polymerase involved in DNA repair